MPAYKLIACDLDETLLSSDASICRRNINAIRKAIACGVKFVPATGRGFRSVEDILKILGLYNQAGQYVIGLNGASITENKNYRSIYWNPLPFETADQLYRRFAAYGLCTHFYTRDTVYICHATADEKAFLNGRMSFIPTNEPTLDFLRGKQEVGKLIVMHPDFTYLKKLHDELFPLLNDISVTFSSNRYMDFTHKGVTKGKALLKLANLLGVAPEETMAVGDNLNDAEMLQAAGLAIGVANLNPSIRPYCNAVTTATNDGGAVGEAIETYIL